jgi:hypothetical protein
MSWGAAKAPPPDPQIGIAARESQQIARDQLKWQKELWEKEIMPRQDEMNALTKEVTGQQMKDAKAASAFAAEQRDQWRETYAPLERRVVQEVQDYDGQDRINQRMGLAGANVTQAFSRARSNAVEEMAKFGIQLDPNAMAAQMRRLGTAEAMAGAGARTGAAMETQNQGLALRAGMVNTGRGLSGGAAQFMGVANQSAAGAVGNSAAAASSLNQGIGTTASGYTSAGAGLNAGAGTLLNLHKQEMEVAKHNPLMDMVSTGIGVYGAMMGSSKKLKDRNTKIDQDSTLEKIRGLPVEKWGYKGENMMHIGPYAEDLQAKFGVGDGNVVGAGDPGGIALAGLKELADKVDRIGRRMGLSLEEA